MRTPKTVTENDLATMAHAAHEQVELPGPEGGWATATINGHFYRAWVGPVPTPRAVEDFSDLAPKAVPPPTSPGPVTGRIIVCGNTCEHDHEGINSPSGCCADHGPYLYYCGGCHERAGGS